MGKIFITGATGFIGSHLAELCVKKGHKVVAFDRYNPNGDWGWLEESKYNKDMEIILGDIRDYDASIAVLYMENISTDENSYFADGLTEELINRLSRIQNLKVKPRTDVAVYKDNPVPINQIAKELNTDYIVMHIVKNIVVKIIQRLKNLNICINVYLSVMNHSLIFSH